MISPTESIFHRHNRTSDEGMNHTSRSLTVTLATFCSMILYGCASKIEQCPDRGILTQSTIHAVEERLSTSASAAIAGRYKIVHRSIKYKYIRLRSDPLWMPLPGLDNGYMFTLILKSQGINGGYLLSHRYASVDTCGAIIDTSGMDE